MRQVLENWFTRKSSPSRPPRVAQPGLETLEDRQLLAASLTASLTNGVLQVEGTAGSDTIVLAQQNNAIRVLGLSGSYSVSQVSRIEINSLEGNDQIRLDHEVSNAGFQAITKSTILRAGSGDDLVVGGLGVDAIFGERHQDQIWGRGGNDYLDGGTGNDAVMGGTGDDTLFGDSGDDHLWGESGKDELWAGYGPVKYLDGGSDIDTLHHSPDWFDLTIDDSTLRQQSRYLYRDGHLTRPDMLRLFAEVGRDGSVSGLELGDLREMVSTLWLGHPAVEVLASKVVYSHPANASFQGEALGNLAIGSSASHLDKLVQKWFFGADRPVASGVYRPVSGSLFVSGGSHEDISQGLSANCYLMAALAGAAEVPFGLNGLISDNGDGTFTVRFHVNGQADYLTVDRFLPTDSSGYAIYASFGGRYDATTNELWVALVEKAYAQLNEAGQIGHEAANSYEAIGFGNSGLATYHVTGQSFATRNTSSGTAGELLSAFHANEIITLGSKDSAPDTRVVRNHAYTLVGYDSATGKFRLFNPHGENSTSAQPAYLELTFAEIQANFSSWRYTT